MIKDDDKHGVDFFALMRSPSVPLAPPDTLPRVPAQPRGGPDDAELHRGTLDAATRLGDVPGAAEAAEATKRRSAMLDLSVAQDDALPGLLVKRGVQGVAVGGIGYLFWRLVRALLRRYGG